MGRTGRMIETTERRGHPVKMRKTTEKIGKTERMRGTTETIEIILSKHKNHPFWKQLAHNHFSNKVFLCLLYFYLHNFRSVAVLTNSSKATKEYYFKPFLQINFKE